jgi:hypothetical protein
MGPPTQANGDSSGSNTSTCGAGSHFGYAVVIPETTRLTRAGEPVYVVAHSTIGGSDKLLDGSGVSVVPASASAPNAPGSVSAVAAGDLSAITVSWTASARATSYQVERTIAGGTWVSQYNGTALSTVLASPAEGTWTFRVRACVGGNCSAETRSNDVVIQHTPPPPASISVPPSSTGPVSVSWSATGYATSSRGEHQQRWLYEHLHRYGHFLGEDRNGIRQLCLSRPRM